MGNFSKPRTNRLGVANDGLLVTIKKINKYNYKRYKGVSFIVGGGNITNYPLEFENAIKKCEVENCTKDGSKGRSCWKCY